MQIQGLFAPLVIGLCATAASAQTQPAPLKVIPPSRPSAVAAPATPTLQTSFLASAGADDCANASTSAISGPGTFPVNTLSATDSPQLGTGCVQPHLDVWFQWTATSTGLAEVTLCGATAADTVLAVWTGSSCPSGAALACNDDFCGLYSRVEVPVTNGSVYLIQIGSYGTNPGFNTTFNVILPPPPPPPTPASMYVDIGSLTSLSGVPSNAYGAAAGVAGTWNARSAATSSTQLNDLAGVPCGAVLTRTGTNLFDFEFNNAATTGDDQALLDDAQDIGGTGGTSTWTFSNLYGGNYRIYTYAWAPDNDLYRTSVSVTGSADPLQTIGGTWTGSHALGVTYAVHNVTGVASGGSIDITVSQSTTFGTLNGFQVVRMGAVFTPYCFGDGSGAACPCGNNGTAGNGCASSVNANGGHLAVSGNASVAADTVVLTGSGMPNSSCLYFQGTTQISISFGDGLRCAGGTVIRLGTKSNVAGTSQYPVAGDASVSVRGLVPLAGATRTYQAWYRNAAAFCTVSTFNLTNGVSIPWQP